MNDIEFVRKQLDDVLDEAFKYAEKDNETKKEFILRLKEKAIILFEQEQRAFTELASYIWGRLENIQFTINRSWYELCFSEFEKQNYNLKYATTQFIKNDDGLLVNPSTGQIKVNDITYSPDLPSEAKPKTLKAEQEAVSSTKDKYTDLLKLIGETFSRGQVTIDAILQRYDDHHLLIKTALEPIEEKLELYAKYHAVISNSKDVMDDRNKWGDYEKIIAKFAMDSGETIAHMAKLMNYSSKFGSIGILNNKELQHKVHQLGLCPNCNIDIYTHMNEKLHEFEIKAQFEI